MALYRVLQQSYINGRIYNAGSEVELDGEPGYNLELAYPPEPAAPEPEAPEPEAPAPEAPAPEAPAPKAK